LLNDIFDWAEPELYFHDVFWPDGSMLYESEREAFYLKGYVPKDGR